MRWLNYLALILIFSLTAFAADISDYPYIFVNNNIFDPIILVGAEAPSKDVITGTIISTNLARFNLTPKVGTSRVDTDIYDITKYDAIVIGNPCVSISAAKLEGNPFNCYEGLNDSTGYVKVFEKDGKVQFLITGLTADDRKIIAEKLAKGELQNVNEKVYSIKTGTGSSAVQLKQIFQNNLQADKNLVEESEEKKETAAYEINEENAAKKTGKYESEIEIEYTKKKGFFARIWDAIKNFFKTLFG